MLLPEKLLMKELTRIHRNHRTPSLMDRPSQICRWIPATNYRAGRFKPCNTTERRDIQYENKRSSRTKHLNLKANKSSASSFCELSLPSFLPLLSSFSVSFSTFLQINIYVQYIDVTVCSSVRSWECY